MAKTLYTGSTTVTPVGSSTSGYRFDAEVIENSTSTAENKSNITCNLYCTGLNGYYYTGHADPIAYINIDGERKKTSSVVNTSTSKQLICTWTGDIVHGTDGKKSIRVTFNYSNGGDTAYYMPNNAKITADPVNLTDIPRYTSVTTWSVASKTETSVTLTWKTANACSQIRYGTSTSSYTTANVSGSSGQVTISGLTAGQNYTFYFMPKRSDSSLWGDGSADTWKNTTGATYNYPYVKTIGSNPLTIGNEQTLIIYNPLGRNITVYMKKDSTSGTQLYSGTSSTAGENVSYKFTPTANTLYASIPNDQSGTAVYYCIYSNQIVATPSGTYKIKGNEYPTFADTNWSYSANLTSLTNNNQAAIDNYSSITVTINTPATSNYGANINKYVVKWGNGAAVDITAGSTTTTVTGSGNVLTITVYDKRNLPKETNKTIINIPYTAVTLSNNTTTNRTNGVEAGVKLNASGTFYNAKFGTSGVQNAIYSAKYYVSTNGTTWSSAYPSGDALKDAITVSGNNFTISNFEIHANGQSGGFAIGTSYYVKLEIKDAQGLLSTGIATTTVTDGKIARDVYKDSNGEYHEGINGLADSNYTEDIHGSLNATNIYKNGNALPTFSELFPIGSIIETYTSTNPSGTYSGTWQRYGTGRVTVDVDTSDSNFNSIGKEGGANSSSYTPAGTIGGTAISVNQMPSHNHSHIYWGGKVQSGYEIGIDNNGIGGFRLSGGWAASNANTTTAFFVTGNSGGGQTHTHSWTGTASTISRLQKYITVYRWRRTA